MSLFLGAMQSIITFFYQLTEMLGFSSYGFAIILMTIAIKMVLYPLTVKQINSMKAMQSLQPKLKELQEKFKGNKERLGQETAKLYKNSGVNPLAGCLPVIIQMPILIGIFYAIRDYSYVNEPSFLWMASLANPDPSAILPFLSAFSTFFMSKQTTMDINQTQQKYMLYGMPIFIGYISLDFPAGLVLYWTISNTIQIAQQWWLYRKTTTVQGEAN